MVIKTEQIITLLQLKGLGRRTVFKICEKINEDNHLIEEEKELFEYLEMCFAKKKIPRLAKFTKNDIKDATIKSNDILERSELKGINITSYFDINFPKALKEIKDPPIIINSKGNLSSLNQIRGIAIIGTRNPTKDGLLSGKHFGKIFGARNYNVVSGLAKGCDTAAHEGCLEAGGITTGILAHGLHMTYPKENEGLAGQIISKDGILISEYFVGTKPLANYFVERDRLQAGLSVATIVIQTAIKGGTMHAVNATINSNKLLAAVKYKKDFESDKIQGNLYLINEENAFPLQSDNYVDFIDLIKSKDPKDYYEIDNSNVNELNMNIDNNNQYKLPF